jgi:hypothetical protein
MVIETFFIPTQQNVVCFRSTTSKRLLVVRQPAAGHDARRRIEQHQRLHQPVVFAERGSLAVGTATRLSRAQLKFDGARGERCGPPHLP